MRLAIVGYRYFYDYKTFSDHVLEWLKVHGGEGVEGVEEIVSGGCEGTDTMAERFARENHFPMAVFRPDWEKWPASRYKWKAFTERDKEIAAYCTHMVAFPSDRGKGTQLTIKFARELDKSVYVHWV